MGWMLAGAVLVLFFFHWAVLVSVGSTFIGAVLAMGRFGRFPLESRQDLHNLPQDNVVETLEHWYISLPDITPSIDILL